MESANKAIMMGFGMIVAVMIMGTIVYVFSSLKALPQENDSQEKVEQIAAFNQEYEVYDKKIMYGVDVISALNKAQSNNEKYVQGKFLSGAGYNTDYIIDIEVILKNPLEETIKLSYLDQSMGTVVERDYMQGQGLNKKAKTIFDAPDSGYCKLIYGTSGFWNDLPLKSQILATQVTSGEYHLLAGNNSSIIPGRYTNAMLEGETVLKALLQQAAEMSQTIRNSGTNRMLVGIMNAGVLEIDEENTGWNTAIWYPAIYDLKTRKFKCLSDEIVYNEKTGRIIKMAFEEI